MECEKKSKGVMTELFTEEDVHNHKPHQLEYFLEVLHSTIKGKRNSEIVEKNFITFYEAVQASNLEINLKSFQETYESLHKKYKIT